MEHTVEEQQPSTSRSSPPNSQECTFHVTVSCGDSVKFENKLVVPGVSLDDAMSRFCGWVQELQDKLSEAIGVKAELDDAKMYTQHPLTTPGHPFVTPSEESSSSSSQGHISSNREVPPKSSLPLQEMNMQLNQIESISEVHDNYKPLTGLEEVSVLKEQEHESQLPPAVSEIGEQQCGKPPYVNILPRGGCQTSTRRHCYAQNRMSCPDFRLTKRIPENTVLGSLPLVLNANMSKSSYSLGTWCTDDEAEGDRTVGHRQNMNPLSDELCLSEEETRAPHHSVKSSANKEERNLVECENPSASKCLNEVSAVREQESNASDEQQRDQVLEVVNAQQVVQPQPASGSGYSQFCDAEQEIYLSEEEEGAHCQQSSGINTSAAEDDQEQAECEKPSANECLKEVSAVQEQEPEEFEGRRSNQILEMIHAQCVAQPRPTAGSGHASSQGTQPDEHNPVIAEPHILPCSLSNGGCLVVPEMNVVPKEISNDGNQQWMFVFNTTSKRYPQEVKEEGFPSKEELKSRNDGELIYSNQKFLRATHLPCGANCRDILPSPWAIKQLVKKSFPFAASMERPWCSLLDHECPFVFQALPHELLLGSGGNGITFEHTLMDRKYAVKWMDYLPKVFDAWSNFHHPNIIPLLAVVKVVRGCYVIMPRMTGNLGSAMIQDLYSLACPEDETWQEILEPNIQHILASVMHGVAYLHKEGYQHCDLKETNILYRKKCKCEDIFHCKCPPEDKCDVMIADFDSLKLYSSARYRQASNAGTPFYRSPEAHCGMVAPCCDMWSIGVIITSLCHNSKERNKIRKNCRKVLPDPDKLKDKRNFPVVETAFACEMLSSLRNKCIKKRDRLEPLARIAGLCLDLDREERVTAQQLLDDDFIKRLDRS